MEKKEKPPIGVKPRFLAEEEYRQRRIMLILFAIERYTKRCIEIPIVWVEEYNEYIKKQNELMEKIINKPNIE